MDNSSGTSGAGQVDNDTFIRNDPFDDEIYTTEYVRRLLAERHHIYAKLYNQGGSVILTATALVDQDRGVEYSTEIGNSFHLDLIELAQQMKGLPKDQLRAMMTWMDGMNSQQAATLLHAKGATTIRKRRERGYAALTRKLNDEQLPAVEGAGRRSDGNTQTGREGEQDDPLSGRDTGREASVDDTEA